MKQSGDFEARIRKSIKSSIDAQQNLLADANAMAEIVKVCCAIVAAFRQGNKVLLFGNGGSAADAQHIAADFVGRFAFNRAALAAIALGVNGSSLTAIGNDYGFERVFARQVEALGRAGDVAVGISTSGNSPNVLRAVHVAREKKLISVGLAGRTGGKLRTAVEHCICIPSDQTPRVQEAHILTGHILCELIEETLFGQS